jgi:hypothetical protein
MCKLMPSGRIFGWHGKLTDLSTNYRKEVSVKIDFGGYVVHNGNRLPKDGPVWAGLAKHQVGDDVYFSGRFGCGRANNLMQFNRMERPEYFVEFDSVQ